MVYVSLTSIILLLIGSTIIAGPAERDEIMTIVLDSDEYPGDEIKYIHDNVEWVKNKN